MEHSYFRNHQLYLAEKCTWLDRQVIKASKRSMMKIESWRTVQELDEDPTQIKLVKKLINDSFFNFMQSEEILERESYYVQIKALCN